MLPAPHGPKLTTTMTEVILENFMSYEYARIPLKPGLNLICGPNGSGKSSILLGISVVLGQTYTERSRRLSGLIRHGKDIARATLMFDNRIRDGKRPIPFCRSDTFLLSRYIRKDGSYWYEADYREIDKSQVVRLFQQFGMNPDNMLIVMHQNMVEEFSITSPQEKLKMVEEAVGFQDYRRRILEAEGRLSGLISEEEAMKGVLEGAEETLAYWREMYEKSLVRKELWAKKAYLEREAIWAQVLRQERALRSLKDRLEYKSKTLADVQSRMERTKEYIKGTYERLTLHQLEQRKLYYSLLELEKQSSEIDVVERILSETAGSIDDEVAKKLRAPPSARRHLEKKISEAQISLGKLEKAINSSLEKYVEHRVNDAILTFRKRGLEDEIDDINKGIKEVEGKLKELAPLLQRAGERIETERPHNEVMADISVTEAHIQALGTIPDQAEEVHNHYSKTFDELKEKVALLSENRERALEEVRKRKEVWRKSLQRLVDEVTPVYQGILSKVDAIGAIRLRDMEDPEIAGLELMVGFRGAAPYVLDAYTQSGGERTASIMAFLLALQQYIKSPFRAVDEFDIHMDPRNRDAVFRMVVSTIREGKDVQYLVITPSQLALTEQDVHVIVVQSVQGKSEVKVAE